MRGGLIIWDAAKLARLADAIETAKRGETPAVWFCNNPPSRWHTDETTHEWSIEKAEGLYQSVKADIAAEPPRHYPENREGREP